MKLTDRECLIVTALRNAQEGTQIESDGSEWGSVYLDNAKPDDMSPKTYRSVLGSLAKKDYYRPQDDGCFGYVRMLNPT